VGGGCIEGCFEKRRAGDIWSWKEQHVISIYQHLEFVSKRDTPPLLFRLLLLLQCCLFLHLHPLLKAKNVGTDKRTRYLFLSIGCLEEKTSNL
jgi:hypothetical protein